MHPSNEDMRLRMVALRSHVEQATEALRGTEGEERDRCMARLREAIRNLEADERKAKEESRPSRSRRSRHESDGRP